MKGSKERQQNNGSFAGYKMTLGYVEFPFVIKYRVNKWDIELGLSFGILVNSKEENLWQEDAFSSAQFEPFEFADTTFTTGMIVGVNPVCSCTKSAK